MTCPRCHRPDCGLHLADSIMGTRAYIAAVVECYRAAWKAARR